MGFLDKLRHDREEKSAAKQAVLHAAAQLGLQTKGRMSVTATGQVDGYEVEIYRGAKAQTSLDPGLGSDEAYVIVRRREAAEAADSYFRLRKKEGSDPGVVTAMPDPALRDGVVLLEGEPDALLGALSAAAKEAIATTFADGLSGVLAIRSGRFLRLDIPTDAPVSDIVDRTRRALAIARAL